jgi:hypothetical protein
VGVAANPERPSTESVRKGMSIDKEGSGFPEVNVHRRTTKVNLGIIIGVAVFFAVCASVIFYLASKG